MLLINMEAKILKITVRSLFYKERDLPHAMYKMHPTLWSRVGVIPGRQA